MVSKASLESVSNNFSILQLTDFAAISAVVGPCLSFLANWFRIDPAGTMLVENHWRDRSIILSKASFESASNNFINTPTH